jgi:hypothetical protein
MKALALLALAGALLASLVQLALAAEPSPEAVKAELDRLAGTWVLVEGWLDGKPVPAGQS